MVLALRSHAAPRAPTTTPLGLGAAGNSADDRAILRATEGREGARLAHAGEDGTRILKRVKPMPTRKAGHASQPGRGFEGPVRR